MTRYVIAVGFSWLAAVYDTSSSGILLTEERDDACSWTSCEKAAEVVRQLQDLFTEPLRLQAVEEPIYPRSWDLEPSCV
jgi:hypothetical protein